MGTSSNEFCCREKEKKEVGLVGVERGFYYDGRNNSMFARS